MLKTLNRKTAPDFNQVNNVEFLHPVKTNLDNGIEVNYLSGGSQEIVKIDFIFNAGILYQPKPLVASATSQLIKEGTKNYTAFEIADGIDNYGAFLETGISHDHASVTLYTLSKHLEKVLPLVQEVILSPAFSDNEFAIYKQNALERFKVNLDKVGFVARKEFMPLVFGKDNPYGGNVDIEDYNNLLLTEIKRFHAQFYSLSNCQIIISGKVTENIISSINHFFGKEPLKKTILSEEQIKNNSSSINNPIYIEKKNALQSAIRIGRLMPNKLHKDHHGLQVLNTVLGGYFGSRLMTNIREDKGYTYGIGSGMISLQEGGYFFISTEVGADVTDKALTEIYKEVEKLREEEISQQELDLIKNYMLGQLLKSCDGPFKMSSLFEEAHLYGLDYSFYDQYIQTIKEITPLQLMELANKYLNKEDLKELVVGKK